MWGTTMALAQIQRVLGNRREAEGLARSLLQIDDPRTAYWLAYAKPVAHALLGDDDAAIRSLEQNVERGQLRRWWYTFEREPALTPSLRADPRFQSLAARVREHAVAALAEKVERGELREDHARRIARQIMRENALALFPSLRQRLWRTPKE